MYLLNSLKLLIYLFRLERTEMLPLRSTIKPEFLNFTICLVNRVLTNEFG